MRLVRVACRLSLSILAFLTFSFASSNLSAQAIRLQVDLTDAPRNIYHAHLIFPAKPGAMTLVFPKWIPGNHRPSGPIAGLTGIRMEAAGKIVAWQRDPVDMYAFHVEIPAGVDTLEVWLDAITTLDSAGGGGPAASSNILDLNWNAVVLYPQGASSDDVEFSPSVKLPSGWKFGTALPVATAAGSEIEFSPVSLTTLIDSPLIAGVHYRRIELTTPGLASGNPPGAKSSPPPHFMDLVADNEGDLAMSPEDLAAFEKLVAETGALFGVRHYRQYHFLLTLSDQVGGHGLEHHESNDSVAAERMLLDPDVHMLYADLVPHEFTHSWNGKYRRPAGLATPNYQEPMVGDLLWVYEGLTEYLGTLLAERSGLWTPEQYREELAYIAAALDHRTGRNWRSLEDTARSVQVLRTIAQPEWLSWRRGLDYYPEGQLLWLDVDTTIRQQTHGKKSLNDFCRSFHGGESGPPKVVPYTFDDVVSGLNAVTPFDWAGFLRARVEAVTAHAPLGGIERGGWKLIYNDQPNLFDKAKEKGKPMKSSDFSYSMGFRADEEGKLDDVIMDSPAYKAGVGPGMKLIAVNGRAFSPEIMRAALKEAHENHRAIEMLIENAQFFQTYSVPYFDGERNPHLERVADQPDILGEILKSLSENRP